MSSKFAECTLGQKYKIVREDGHVAGGAMLYLRTGLEDLGWPRLGRVLSVVFAFMCIGGSFGGGNMFQSNQSYAQLASVIPALDGAARGDRLRLRAGRRSSGTVIVGGIQAASARWPSVLVPFDVRDLRGLRPR